MSQKEMQPRLIPCRTAALVALILTGLVMALDLYDAIYKHPRQMSWLFEPASFQPLWVTVALNILFYGYFAWIGFEFCKSGLGKERILVAGWFITILSTPIQRAFSIPVPSVLNFNAACMIMAFVAAIELLREYGLTGRHSDS
jgi:hypothetical protein